jgi:hypothetical protein
MTCIVSPSRYPTKKALREAVALHPDEVTIEDPALMPEWRKHGSLFSADTLKPGEEVVVTNHPKRSGFAQVGRKADGTLFVK